MTAQQSRRGEPLVALTAILAMWVGARALFWDVRPVANPAEARDRPAATLRIAAASTSLRKDGLRPPNSRPAPFAMLPQFLPPRAPVSTQAPFRASRLPLAVFAPEPARGVVGVPLAAAHQVMWMAALARVPVPPELLAAVGTPAAAPFAPAARPLNGPSRWSADAWFLLRRGDGVSLAQGPAQASYGASQAGAVLRYRLAPGSAHRPAAYVRATAALGGSREREAAVGLSARVVPDLPVVAAAELRATMQSGRTRLRPAVFAVTELAPAELPGGLRAEAYAQAGYVGGSFATAFVDGQLRVDGRAARIGTLEVRAGAGAWGGAQKGAARLDVGPTASIGLAGTPSARLAVDWRFRVAGNAAPASGPAVTLSAGF